MPAYHVKRTITVEKSADDILNFLSDFRSWPTWSPWLIMEPDCDVQYHGTQGQKGAGYHWIGDMVGEGKMTLREKTAESLDVALEFIKPFKSLATATFVVKPQGNSSEVTWLLDAKLPFFLFFLKNMLQQSLGMDYERGLKMLKSLLETGEVPSELRLIGKKQKPAQHYIALEGQATIPELATLIPSDYEKLWHYAQENNIEPSGAPFTLYYEMDMATTMNQVRNCFPVASPVDVKAPFICDRIEAGNAYVVEHKGAYPFIGNAWSFAMFAARHFKVKLKKKPVGYEHYISDPKEVAEKDLITEIVLFAK